MPAKLVGTKEELLGLVRNQFESDISFLQLSHISKMSAPKDDSPECDPKHPYEKLRMVVCTYTFREVETERSMVLFR